jgi:hypothetical protein
MTRLLAGFVLLGVLLGCSGAKVEAVEPTGPKVVLLLAQGPDGHPEGTHEYLLGLRLLEKELAKIKGVEPKVVLAEADWPQGPELLEGAHAVVLYLAEGGKWIQSNPKVYEAFDTLAKRGAGLVVLHWAMGTKEAVHIDGFVRLFGGCHGGEDRKYKFLETSVSVVNPDHPITKGIEPFRINDEFYYDLKFAAEPPGVEALLTARIDDVEEVVAWAWVRPDGGRSFGFSGLHYVETWDNESYRRVVSQATLWTLGMDSTLKR